MIQLSSRGVDRSTFGSAGTGAESSIAHGQSGERPRDRSPSARRRSTCGIDDGAACQISFLLRARRDPCPDPLPDALALRRGDRRTANSKSFTGLRYRARTLDGTSPRPRRCRLLQVRHHGADAFAAEPIECPDQHAVELATMRGIENRPEARAIVSRTTGLIDEPRRRAVRPKIVGPRAASRDSARARCRDSCGRREQLFSRWDSFRVWHRRHHVEGRSGVCSR